MKFKIIAHWGHSRLGLLELPHGKVKTPVFMPVGTKASVKAVSPHDLEQLGAQIILGNTYHLYLQPGSNIVKQQGGLHSFAKWPKPMLTDSGGFQVSSLGLFRQDDSSISHIKAPTITQEGVVFWSHLNGSKHEFNAEKSIQVQTDLGADIIMAFDEATPDRGREYASQAMSRTHDWLLRSIYHWRKLEAKKDTLTPPQFLFGIIQGGNYPDLRKISAEFVSNQDLPGIALGGGSVGANRFVTSQNVDWVRDYIPSNKPFYLMGVGVNPEDVISAVLDGADMFDCVAPTRLARSGILYNGQLILKDVQKQDIKWQVEFNTQPQLAYVSQFSRGRINISNARYTQDTRPISEDCYCYTCKTGFSRSYLRHLYKAKELLYYRLASIHNLHFITQLTYQLQNFISQFAASK